MTRQWLAMDCECQGTIYMNFREVREGVTEVEVNGVKAMIAGDWREIERIVPQVLDWYGGLLPARDRGRQDLKETGQ